MVANPRKRFITPQEYLDFERKAEKKHEYDNGRIVAMAGASTEHNMIVFNTSGIIWSQLDRQKCRGLSSDMRTGIPACNGYFYPDLSIVCGEQNFEEGKFDTLLNPVVIIEVLSPTTEYRDRNLKFDCYWTIASLTDYIIIAQSAPRIEHWSRLSDGNGSGWKYVVASGLEAILNLPSVGCELCLGDIYAGISFPPTDQEPSTDYILSKIDERIDK